MDKRPNSQLLESTPRYLSKPTLSIALERLLDREATIMNCQVDFMIYNRKSLS
jgi:hypothetical protein